MTKLFFYSFLVFLTLTANMTLNASSEPNKKNNYLTTVTTNTPKILTSIKPLQLIAIAITGQAKNTEVLLADNISPHNYQLKFSDTNKIESADIIIWVGSELEYFLTKIINRFNSKKCIITMLNLQNLNLLTYKDKHNHHNQEHQQHSSDCKHGIIDTHVWMSIDNAAVLATALAKELTTIDKKNSSIYEHNLQCFLLELQKFKHDSNLLLANINTAEIFTFHDAYGYLEQQYNFSITDYLSADALKEPGAKHLQQLKNKLLQAKSPTILLEPQFDAKAFKNININNFASISYIDPLASDILASSDGYILFMMSLVDSLKQCIPEKNN